MRWRVPLRADGAPAPCRVPLLPSLDAADGSAIWRPGELTEAGRRQRYASAASAGSDGSAVVHGSVLLPLASDFLCAKCQQQFVRERTDSDFTDDDIATWWQRLQMAPAKPKRSVARAAVLGERERARMRSAAARCVTQGEQSFAEFCELLKLSLIHI